MRTVLITCLLFGCLLTVVACEDSDSELEIWEEEQGLEHDNLSWEELREMKREQ